MPSYNNPRAYVKALPLPVEKQHGIIIQARCQDVYNPTIPTRDEMRKINYQRRLLQLTQQGFRSVNYQPYQGVGDPFYLDQKKLILSALGQWEEGEDEANDVSSSDTSDDEGFMHQEKQAAKSTSKFMLRRTRKGLNTLNKEVSHGREMIRNVRLGHGLFQLLQKESNERTEAKQRELKKKRDAMWNEWLPPKSDADTESDVTDDDLEQDVDLKQYMMASSVFEASEDKRHSPTFLTQPAAEANPMESRTVLFRDAPSATTLHMTDMTKSVVSINPGSTQRGSKKKTAMSRPYTPQHSNISTEYSMKPDKQALFRQLCALYWLLEAMNTTEQSMMSPITTCWNLKDMGGYKTPSIGKHQKEKYEHKWKQFASNQVFKPQQKRYSTARSSIRPAGRYGSALPRSSLSSTPSDSQSALYMSSGSQSQIPPPSTVISGRRPPDQGPIPESDEYRGGSEAEPEDQTAKYKDKCVSEDGVGLSKSDSHDGEKTSVVDEGLLSLPDAHSAPHHVPVVPDQPVRHQGPTNNMLDDIKLQQNRRNSLPKRTSMAADVVKQMQAQILDSINRSEEDPRLHRLAHPTEKRCSTSLRAEYNVRPKSSPAVLEYQASLPSNRRGNLSIQLHQEFDEVTEEKALGLHDTIESIDRDRVPKLRNMFVNLPTRTSLHKALDRIRSRNSTEKDSGDKHRRLSIHQQWYMDLLSAIPEEMKQDWYFDKILDKLSKYGLVESSKQSAYKFRRVLTALREWEVCSPDISAAIEFCREKIIEMTVEEYEEWFLQMFPNIVRPQTAPPGASQQEDKHSTNIQRHQTIKSAPAGHRKRYY